MKSDFESQTRSRRKWTTSSRYLHADNDSAATPKALGPERAALALVQVHRTTWGSPSQFLGANRDNDDEIAQHIARLLEQMTSVAPGQIRAEVESGWVTLRGQMDWNYQHARITAAIRDMPGVQGIADELTVKTRTLLTLNPQT